MSDDRPGAPPPALDREALPARRRRLVPAATLGLALPLLWLLFAPLRDLQRRGELHALLEAAGCDVANDDLVIALFEAEERFGVDAALLVAVAAQESTCRERAVGAGGSRGLLQLRPTTARDVARRHRLGWRDADHLFDAEYSVLVGSAHLSELYDRHGSWGAALSAYNLGETRYRALSRRHGSAITSRYARTVLRRRDDLERRAATR